MTSLADQALTAADTTRRAYLDTLNAYFCGTATYRDVDAATLADEAAEDTLKAAHGGNAGPDWTCPDCGVPVTRRCRPSCPNND